MYPLCLESLLNSALSSFILPDQQSLTVTSIPIIILLIPPPLLLPAAAALYLLSIPLSSPRKGQFHPFKQLSPAHGPFSL